MRRERRQMGDFSGSLGEDLRHHEGERVMAAGKQEAVYPDFRSWFDQPIFLPWRSGDIIVLP